MKRHAAKSAVLAWVGVVALLLFLAGGSPAFAQSQTAQSIMVQLDYDNTAYQIDGTITWTYQRDTCAVGKYTANPGVWDGIAPTCTGGGHSVTACPPTSRPSRPRPPSPPRGRIAWLTMPKMTAAPSSAAETCPAGTILIPVTVNGLNGRGNWTFTYNYTTVGAGDVAANTCWTSQSTGGTVDAGFSGFVCSESFLKQQSTRRKYSFTLSSPEGSRVSNVQVELQQFDGANWNNVSGPFPVTETDLLTGQLPFSATTGDYDYFGNGGAFGNAAVLGSLHYSSGKPANNVDDILKGLNDGATNDNFANNDNDLAAGNVHQANFTGEWPGLTQSGTYRTVVTGTLKGNSGQADTGFAVTSSQVVIGGCSCGS